MKDHPLLLKDKNTNFRIVPVFDISNSPDIQKRSNFVQFPRNAETTGHGIEVYPSQGKVTIKI